MNEQIERDLGCTIPAYATIVAILVSFFAMLLIAFLVPEFLEESPIKAALMFTSVAAFTQLVTAYFIKVIVTQLPVFDETDERKVRLHQGEKSGFVYWDK